MGFHFSSTTSTTFVGPYRGETELPRARHLRVALRTQVEISPCWLALAVLRCRHHRSARCGNDPLYTVWLIEDNIQVSVWSVDKVAHSASTFEQQFLVSHLIAADLDPPKFLCC